MKREIPLIITFLIGLFFTIQFYVPKLDDIGDGIQRWGIVVSAFALLVAIGNLLRVHISNVQKKRKNWGYSLILLIAFFLTTVIGFIDKGNVEKHTNFSFIYKYIYNPLQATMFSMLAFYVASAAFRAFRVKTKEATLLLLAGFLVMLGRVPIGGAIWSKFPAIQAWIMNYPVTAGMRAIMIGVAIGAVTMSIKIILGFERSYLGGGE